MNTIFTLLNSSVFGEAYKRAAMVLSKFSDLHPHLLAPHIEQLVNVLIDKQETDAKIRTLVRFFQFYELPEKLQGIVLDRCYELLKDIKSAVAIRAFSIGVIYKISKAHPELKKELKIVLEDLNTEGSIGLENRRKNILKLL